MYDSTDDITAAARARLNASQVAGMKRRIEDMADAVEAAHPDGSESALYDQALVALQSLGRVENMLAAGNPWDAFAAFKAVKG